jgi:hypothetical protein
MSTGRMLHVQCLEQHGSLLATACTLIVSPHSDCQHVMLPILNSTVMCTVCRQLHQLQRLTVDSARTCHLTLVLCFVVCLMFCRCVGSCLEGTSRACTPDTEGEGCSRCNNSNCTQAACWAGADQGRSWHVRYWSGSPHAVHCCS